MFNCFECNEATDEKCQICQTPYCSEKCRQENAIDHQVFCHPHLHLRIKSVADYVIDNLGRLNTWYLCSGFYGLETRTKRKMNMSAFGKNHGNGHCVICALVCITPKDHTTYYMSYRGVTFMYYICFECKEKGYQMCQTSFAEVGVCARYNGITKWLTFLACLKRLEGGRMCPRVPKDIKRLILIDNMVCSHPTPYGSA